MVQQGTRARSVLGLVRRGRMSEAQAGKLCAVEGRTRVARPPSSGSQTNVISHTPFLRQRVRAGLAAVHCEPRGSPRRTGTGRMECVHGAVAPAVGHVRQVHAVRARGVGRAQRRRTSRGRIHALECEVKCPCDRQPAERAEAGGRTAKRRFLPDRKGEYPSQFETPVLPG